MRATPALLAVLAAALLALPAGRAMAAPVLAPPVPPSAVIAPGEMVVTPVPALPADAEEFELILVPESGAPIHVTAERRVGAREVRWRMPAVAARSARLVLRAGDEHEEWESAPSAPFALAGLPASELPRLLGGRSEAGVALESSAGAAAPGFGVAPDAPSLEPGSSPACVAAPESSPIAAPGENTLARGDAASRIARPAPAFHHRTRTPAFRPLRN